MNIYTSKTPLFARRITEEFDEEIGVGDQIRVGKYTATCQKTTKQGAFFLLDQYLDEPRPMNEDGEGRPYEESDLRKFLQSEKALKEFRQYRERMATHENGDLLRIPTFSEIFGDEDADYFEELPGKQWELMKDRKNRIAFRKGEWEWGWLQNRRKGSATNFANVDGDGGHAYYFSASGSIGVRPAFLII